MGIAAWYFLRHRPGELEPVSRKAFDAFFFKGGALPTSEDGFIRHTEVLVQLHERRAVEVLKVGFFQYRALADGTIDQESRDELMRTAGITAFGWISLSDTPPGVIKAEHRFARRRLDHMKNWEPTEADLDALRELVNHRAKARLM